MTFEIEVVLATAYLGDGFVLRGNRLPSAPLVRGTDSRSVAAGIALSLAGIPAEPWGLLQHVGFVDRKEGPQAVLYAWTLPEKPALTDPSASWVKAEDIMSDPAYDRETRAMAFRSVYYEVSRG